ncbi:helix-turn-helix domain-containing protein [Microbacterium sp. 22242]|uniref:helix-turn-helix domain-containing protein n=1 Tax=Microbacterium sp. 22242 TaxID=3453896 RepID=UPI003F87CDF7
MPAPARTPGSDTGALGDFLRSRRDALTPEDAGIVAHGLRRVPGLRREELAQLAGVSVAYYTRLEQGQSIAASDGVLDALARALQLRDDERSHLFALATPRPSRRRRPPRAERPAPGGLALLAAMDGVPALVLGRRGDVLAWNPLGHALLAGHVGFDAPAHPGTRPNTVRMLFLDPHTRDLHRDWAAEATLVVASLRFIAAQHPDDSALAALVGELSMNSPEFAALWARHAVELCSSGTKHLHHPEVGDLDVQYQALHLPGAEGQRLLAHTVDPGSSSADALRLLREAVPARPGSAGIGAPH